MIFKNPANLIEAAKTVSQLNYICLLLDPRNGEMRWDALQDWLKANPQYQKTIERIVEMPPDRAYEHLLSQTGIDQNLIRLYDPMGDIVRKIQYAIGELQKLYRERKQLDKPVKAIKSKPAKKKTIKAVKPAKAKTKKAKTTKPDRLNQETNFDFIEGEIIK